MKHICLVLLWGAAVSAPAYAEGGPAVDEVVITGTPYARTAGDILSHVDVVTADELSHQSGGLGDVLAHVPGVKSTFFGPGASRPVIRGLSGYRVQVLTNGIGMLDAASLSPDHAPAAEPMTAERIEIFRGPAALAYGGAAIGGVVNVIDQSIPMRLPKQGGDLRLRSFVSSVDDGLGFVGDGTFALARTAFNLGVSVRTADDYTSATGVVENSAVDAAAFGVGAAQHFDRGVIGASVQRLDTQYGIPGEDATIDLQQTRYAVQGQYDLASGWLDRVRATVGVADYTHAEIEDGAVGTRFDVSGYEVRIEASQRASTKRPGGVGVQYAARDVTAMGDEAFIPSVAVVDMGMFAQKQMDFGRWGFEAGARLDHASRETASTARDYTNWSAAGGVYIRPADGVKLGLSLARTARAPGEAELFADGPHVATGSYEVGDADLKTEVATTFEASLTASRGRVALDLHAFYADFKNYIDLYDTGDTEDGLPVYAFLQSDADFQGGEAKLTWNAFEAGNRYITLDAAVDGVRGKTKDGNVPRMPPLSTTWGLNAGVGEAVARLEWVHAAAQTRVAVDETETPGYDVWNASFDVPLGASPVVLQLQGQNLTDEDVRLSTSFLKDTAPLTGRNVRIGIKARF